MNEILLQLIEDHNKILIFVDELENDLINFMQNDILDSHKMHQQIKFIREFADKEHHQREEKILFKYMCDNLGSVAQNLIQHGMLVEHDLGRFSVKQWELHLNKYVEDGNLIDKLSILSNAHNYCELIKRHIDKENNVVFPFANRSLSNEIFDLMIIENNKL